MILHPTDPQGCQDLHCSQGTAAQPQLCHSHSLLPPHRSTRSRQSAHASGLMSQELTGILQTWV